MTTTAPTLRNYQEQIVTDYRAALRAGYKCPLLRADTGAGKTIIFSYITHGAALKGNPVLITAHRKEIIRQISLSLAKFGVMHQVIAPADKIRQIKITHFRAFGKSFVSSDATTMVGSVQTVVGRFGIIDATMKRAGPGKKLIAVFDEGHHVTVGTTWGRVMDYCRDNFDTVGLLVTASPGRLDGRGLGAGHGGYADTMIEAPPMTWLIENGFLSPYRVFTAANPIDMTGAGHRAGDYKTEEIEERANKPSITGDAIQHWRKHANGMRTVVFCASIKHSKAVAAEFNAAGIAAAHIDGSIDDSERDQAIVDFADDKILVLTQVNLVSEGFDLGSIAQKDVTIDCLVDLAPTESLVNAMQRWGRVLRPRPGKLAIILDHAANIGAVVGGEYKPKHGMPDMIREWSLEGKKKSDRKNDGEKDVPITSCPKCYAVFSPVDGIIAGRKAAARAGTEYAGPCCPMCDSVMPVRVRQIEVVDGSLEEITADQIAAAKLADRIQQGRAQSVDELVAIGKNRKQAEKIIEAREEKRRLVDAVIEAGADAPVYEIRKMKPKELKNWLAELVERQGMLV